MSLPVDHILHAVYDRLTSELDVDVRYAGSGGAAPGTYVALQLPSGQPRDTKTSRGYTAQVVARCHTEHAAGEASPLEVMQLASKVDDALDGFALDLGPSHAALFLDSPSYNDSEYALKQGRRALDYVLTFPLLTQQLT